jgi:hypothetical protein
VVILAPVLGIAVTDSIDVGLRYWLTTVIAGGPGGTTSTHVAHSVGARVGMRVLPKLSLALDYSYGIQLERNPTSTDFLDLRSHIVSLIGVVNITKTFGVDASVSVERRMAKADVWGPAVEVGAFVRW